MTTDPLALLRTAETYLAVTHEHVFRHDNLGADYTCGGCQLRERIAAALAEASVAADPCHPCGCPRRFNRHADGCPTRDRIVESLLTTPNDGWTYTPGHEKWDHHKHGDRPGHDFGIYCALCKGNVDVLADAVLAVLPALADRAAVTPPPALTEEGCLRSRVQVLEEDAERDQGLAKVGARCMREGHQGLIETGRATVEGHRFALSVKLGLGTGATWDAIHERATDLRRMADEAQQAQPDPQPGDRVRITYEGTWTPDDDPRMVTTGNNSGDVWHNIVPDHAHVTVLHSDGRQP